MSRGAWDSCATAILLAFLVVGAWHWQAVAGRQAARPLAEESSQSVRTTYPMPESPRDVAVGSEVIWQAVVQANPFSPERRHTASNQPGGKETQPEARPNPTFVYKGRILMGAKQRAILQEVQTKKTYFVEPGQDASGFRVIDITENAVVLLDPKTQQSLTVNLVSSSSSPENRKPAPVKTP